MKKPAPKLDRRAVILRRQGQAIPGGGRITAPVEIGKIWVRLAARTARNSEAIVAGSLTHRVPYLLTTRSNEISRSVSPEDVFKIDDKIYEIQTAYGPLRDGLVKFEVLQCHLNKSG